MAGILCLLKQQNSLEITSGKKEMTPNTVVNWPFSEDFPSEPNYCEKRKK